MGPAQAQTVDVASFAGFCGPASKKLKHVFANLKNTRRIAVYRVTKKKVCWVVSCEFAVNSFLLDQIAVLQEHYDLTLIVNTDNPRFLGSHGSRVRVIPVGIERQISLWRDLRAQARLIWIFVCERFDVVHSITPKAGLLAMVAGWLARVPNRIHTFQGEVWITRQGFWRMFLKAMDKLVARLATRLLVVSFSEQKFLLEQGIVPSGKSQVLAKGSICGVNTTRFRPDLVTRAAVRKQLGLSDSDKLFLYVGRLLVDKGVLELAAAFSRLCNTYPDVHLLVVGPDEHNMRDKMLSLMNAAHHQRLQFYGYTKTPEQFMTAADVLCLPSYREGFGVVIIEAAAVGIPTVASRIYGIMDAIEENVTGFLHEPRDSEALHDQMKRLIDNPDIRKKMGEDARLRAQRDFSRESVTAAVVAYYKKMIG